MPWGPRPVPAPLPVRERVLGPEYLDTLNVQDNLAYWTRKARRGRRVK
jgi:hypothetical protein